MTPLLAATKPQLLFKLNSAASEIDIPESSNPPAATLLDAALAQVEQHYGEKLRQSAAAAACGMSVCAFSRAFKAQYGLTFRDYLLRYRIGRACELLRQGLHGVTEAGLAVGFDDASHFSRAFRRALGISPSSYQRGLNGIPAYPSIASGVAPTTIPDYPALG